MILSGSGRRAYLKGALLAVLSLLITWSAGEVLFHLAPNPYCDIVMPDQLDAWHAAGKDYVYTGALLHPRQSLANRIHWNSHGWNDVEHMIAKPPGVTRVLIVGDSFVEAVQVPLKDALQRRLEGYLTERLARPVEVVALAESGWGQIDELLAIYREGLAYSPDLVVAEFLSGNDVRDNDDDLRRLVREQDSSGSAARKCFLSALTHNFFFTAFMCDRADSMLQRAGLEPEPLDFEVYRNPPVRYPELWSEAWRRTAFAAGAMKKLLAEHQARLLIVAFTSTLEISAWAGTPTRIDLDGRLPTERMAVICERAAIPFLSLAQRFARLPDGDRARIHIADDGHWTSYGHSLAANEIAQYVVDNRLLP